MKTLLHEMRENPLLWLLIFVPVVFVAEAMKPAAHELLFFVSILAIVPLAVLLSLATEDELTPWTLAVALPALVGLRWWWP